MIFATSLNYGEGIMGERDGNIMNLISTIVTVL